MSRLNNLARIVLLIGITLSAIFFIERPCLAQVAPLTQSVAVPESVAHDHSIALTSSAPVPSEASEATLPDPPKPNSSGDDSDWHIDLSPYLWFPGVHGTIGALGRDISVHATPGDLLSNFRFGLMGAVEARKKRILLPLDLMWVRLGTSKGLPFPGLEAISADVKGGEFLLTPKIGYRVIDQEKIKVDALTGFRYWHFYESVAFVPTNTNLNFSKSQDWVDPLVGGRITGMLAPKVVVTIFGDVGGWGTGSQLEYQVGGAVGYKIKPRWTLQAGYRYLDMDYRNGTSIADLITSGALFGVTINLK